MGTVGKRLQDARQRRFLTQDELAEVSGIRKVTISRIENDHHLSQPRLATIRKLAHVLEVDPEWILFGEIREEGKLGAGYAAPSGTPDTGYSR